MKKHKTKHIVVGGSPTLLNRGYGSIIESYDKIIRVNLCHTYGTNSSTTRSDLGKRTNIWCSSWNTKKNKEIGYKNFFLPETLDDKTVWFRHPQGKADYSHIIEEKFGNFESDILTCGAKEGYGQAFIICGYKK